MSRDSGARCVCRICQCGKHGCVPLHRMNGCSEYQAKYPRHAIPSASKEQKKLTMPDRPKFTATSTYRQQYSAHDASRLQTTQDETALAYAAVRQKSRGSTYFDKKQTNNDSSVCTTNQAFSLLSSDFEDSQNAYLEKLRGQLRLRLLRQQQTVSSLKKQQVPRTSSTSSYQDAFKAYPITNYEAANKTPISCPAKGLQYRSFNNHSFFIPTKNGKWEPQQT